MATIMTTQDVAKYLKLHPITINKFAREGKIPGVQIGRAWRFDKETIDRWIAGGKQPEISDQIHRTIIQKKSRKKRVSRRKE